MNQMPICDTHAHYDDDAFDSDRDILLDEGLKEGGVEFAVNVGASIVLSKVMGMSGLALGTMLSYVCYMAVVSILF